MKRGLIKILVCMFLACISAFSLLACGGNSDSENNASGGGAGTSNGGGNNNNNLPPQCNHVYVDKQCNVCGERQPSVGLSFELNQDQTAYVVAGIGTCSDTEIAFPLVYNNKLVKEIKDSAFKDNDKITKVYIPKSITTIGVEAFYDCNSLQYVKIGDGVTLIENKAFWGCDELLTVDMGSKVEKIGISAFQHCYLLTNITLPNTLTSIADYSFASCSSIPELKIPISVTQIGKHAFYYCKALVLYCEAETRPSGWNSGWIYSSGVYFDCPVVWDCNNNSKDSNRYPKEYTIVDGVSYYINDEGQAWVRRQPLSLIEANIPKNIIYKEQVYDVFGIMEGAFAQCELLKSVTIEKGLQKIYLGAFSGCYLLDEITIPDSVTYVDEDVFKGCEALVVYCEATKEPTAWENGWKGEKKPAIWNCENNDVADDGYMYPRINGIRYQLLSSKANVIRQGNLAITEVTIPASVTYKGITYPTDRVESYAFYECTSITKVTLPSTCKFIGRYTFYCCTSLTSVTIPNSVIEIAGDAFLGCESLASITIPSSVTRIDKFSFANCDSLTEVKYQGTIAQWGAITRSVFWIQGSPATKVICIDGEVVINK